MPARGTATPRRAIALCAALYAASIAALHVSHLGRGWGFVDLDVYRYGGEAVLRGSHLYALRFPGALAFTYPPLAALLFTALTLPARSSLTLLASAANVLLLPLMLGFALRLQPVASWLSVRRAACLALVAAAAAVWLEPVWTTLRYGQIDLLIGALVLWDLGRRDAARFKGAGVGLAAALKLTPAIFAIYLLLTRRYRAAAVALGVFATTVAVGFALAPGDSSEYWGGAFISSSRVGRIENAANQSLRGALVRLSHTPNVELVWICAAALVALAGLALAAGAGRRGDDAQGFSLCALTALLVSPISWSHHWALAVPVLLLFGVRAYRRRALAGVLAAAAVALIACSHMIWWVPVNHPPHSELHLDPLQLVYADAYVAIGSIALAGCGWWALGVARRRSPGALGGIGRISGRRPRSPRWEASG